MKWRPDKIFFFYAFAVLLVIFPWFLRSGYIFLTDFVWGPHIILDWTDSWFAVFLVVKFLSFILPVDLIQKLFVGFALAVVLAGGAKIAKVFVKDKYAVFSLSLFFLFNPFVYDRLLYGQVNVVLAYGFFAWGIGFLLENLFEKEAGKNRNLVFAGLLFGLSILFSPHFIFIIGLFAFFYAILFLLKLKENPALLSREKNFAILKTAALALFVLLAVNANWLAASFFSNSDSKVLLESGISQRDLIAFKTSGGTPVQALKNVLEMSGFWGKDQSRYIDLSDQWFWGFGFSATLLLVVFGFVSAIFSGDESGGENENEIGGEVKKTKRNLALALLALIFLSAILAAGVSFYAPLAERMFDKIPFYKGMREPQKWVSLIAISYGILISMALGEIAGRKNFGDHKKFFLPILCAVFFAQAPFLAFGFYGQATPAQYPDDWKIVDREISKNISDPSGNCSGNILFLPWHMYMKMSFTDSIALNPSFRYFSCPVIFGNNIEFGGIYDNGAKQYGEPVYEWILLEGKTDFLDANKFDIKYVVLSKNSDWKKYQWLSKNPRLVFVEETQTLILYKVILYKVID